MSQDVGSQGSEEDCRGVPCTLKELVLDASALKSDGF